MAALCRADVGGRVCSDMHERGCTTATPVNLPSPSLGSDPTVNAPLSLISSPNNLCRAVSRRGPGRSLLSFSEPLPVGTSPSPPCCRARLMKWLGINPAIAIVVKAHTHVHAPKCLMTSQPRVISCRRVATTLATHAKVT